MGFVVEVLLGRRLTVLSNFHSHLESLGYIEEETFRNQISFSYSRAGNVLSLNEAFDHRLDPTRLVNAYVPYTNCKVFRRSGIDLAPYIVTFG